jgi:hypothetical protein
MALSKFFVVLKRHWEYRGPVHILTARSIRIASTFPTNFAYRDSPNSIPTFRCLGLSRENQPRLEAPLKISQLTNDQFLGTYSARKLDNRVLPAAYDYLSTSAIGFRLRASRAMVTRDTLHMSARLIWNRIHSSSYFVPLFLRLQSDCSQGMIE